MKLVGGRLAAGAELVVRDDGRGFDPGRHEPRDPEDGFGLFSLRERLLAAGGTLEITSAPGRGTAAVVRLPLAEGAAP